MSEVRPIIIKKKKGGGGHGHHGGAWKVAYADFVTAMMAFFLLMWLLNATSEEQRKGLADFFDPSLPISRVSAGGAGMLNGDTMFSEDQASGSQSEGIRAETAVTDPGENLGDLEASPDLPEGQQSPSDAGLDTAIAWPTFDTESPRDREFGAGEYQQDSQATVPVAPDTDGTDGESRGSVGDREFDELAEDLAKQMLATQNEGLLEHFSMRSTPEGLVIELVDIQGEPLFSSGDAAPEPILRILTEVLVPVLEETTNDIAIAGHTDAQPFRRADYSNWELSSDRANASRRLMVETGLNADRIVRVSGRAATDPIDPDPFASKNRRIAIILLRESAGN